MANGISREELAEAVSAATATAIASVMATLPQMQTPGNRGEMTELLEAIQRRNPTELDKMGITPERQARMMAPVPTARYRRVPLVGDHGAAGHTRAVAIVREAPGFPNGRIDRFERYTHPKGLYRHQSQGGVVPDGLQIAFDNTQEIVIAMAEQLEQEPNSHAFSLQYVMWKKATYWDADHSAWIGKELKSHMCDPSGAGLETPWEADDSERAAA